MLRLFSIAWNSIPDSNVWNMSEWNMCTIALLNCHHVGKTDKIHPEHLWMLLGNAWNTQTIMQLVIVCIPLDQDQCQWPKEWQATSAVHSTLIGALIPFQLLFLSSVLLSTTQQVPSGHIKGIRWVTQEKNTSFSLFLYQLFNWLVARAVLLSYCSLSGWYYHKLANGSTWSG